MKEKQINQTAQHPVSAGNPCPFLRALVADGKLADRVEPLGNLVSTIVDVAKKGEGAPDVKPGAIRVIAMIANGLSPWAVLRSNLKGVQIDALRSGPLNKKGVGSGILNATGEVDPKELARLKEFASQKTSSSGTTELGLSLAEITTFMDANFERAKGKRRRIDRALMNGEWPVLLRVMGKKGTGGRYLSLADVETLVVERRLPERMRN
jgi:hypothetical protein